MVSLFKLGNMIVLVKYYARSGMCGCCLPVIGYRGGQGESTDAVRVQYPTLMAMTGQPCLATELDGINCWPNLKARTECRPSAIDDAVFWMWLDHGTVRTKKWKLFYSESRNRVELYDVEKDVGETTNLASAEPEVCEALIKAYCDWIKENNYAMTYITIDPGNMRDTGARSIPSWRAGSSAYRLGRSMTCVGSASVPDVWIEPAVMKPVSLASVPSAALTCLPRWLKLRLKARSVPLESWSPCPCRLA